MILVSIPYFQSAETLYEAVHSLLKQSYQNYELLIINDGDSPSPKEILGIKHPKLKYFDLKENHGRYFCDAVALAANPYKFFMPSDSDDTSNFHRLYHLKNKQRKTDADMTYHYQQVITRTGKIKRETYPLMQRPLSERMFHLAHWSALYKTKALKGVGGIHPDFRVGYDTLLVDLIRMKYKTACVPRFLYTRKSRPESLTACRETGFGSSYRRAVAWSLQELYTRCYEHPNEIKQTIQGSINPETMKAVRREARRLKKEVWGG